MLSITTDTTETKLVSVAMARRRLGTSSSQDTELGELIDEVSAAIASRIFGVDPGVAPTLGYTVYSETARGYGEHELRLSRWPLLSTTVSVTFQAAGSTASTSVSSTSYNVREGQGTLFATTGWLWTAQYRGDIEADPYPGSEHESFTVAFGAGYRLPSSASSTQPGHSLPLDLRSAALRLVQGWSADFGLVSASTTFKRIRTDDFEVENFSPKESGGSIAVGEIPDSIGRIIDRYRMEW